MLALSILSIAIGFANYGDTPAHAILHDLYVPAGSHIVIERVNVVGRYATVLSRGAVMAGLPVDVPILLERFAFGWQALESLDFRCRLDVHALTLSDQRALLRGMPQPRNDRPCSALAQRDSGPERDVEAVRRRMRGTFIPQVNVADGFALGQWYDGGGGEALFRKRGSHWSVIYAHGGGPFSSDLVLSEGVPASDLCAFGIYNAKCPPKH